MTTATETIESRALQVRRWMIENVAIDTLKFPNDDAVWEFITTTWPRISTEAAERVLNEAMRPLDR